MSDQREIIDHLTKTLELLNVEKSQLREHKPVAEPKKVETQDLIEYSHSYIDFTYENPTIYHLTATLSQKLENAGFSYLSEKENWQDKLSRGQGGKFYTIRNGTNLSAFVVGEKWDQSKGVGAIGAHADSLTAKLKPLSKKSKVEGYELLGVAPYGGTLNDLWFDRDLGIGGRILYKDGDQFKSKLINSAPHPIARIPSLAPHFGEPAIPPFDKETQAVPVVGFSQGEEGEEVATAEEQKSALVGKHSLQLLRYVSKLAGINVSQLAQLDLDLFDVQKGAIGGLKDDFLFAPRIDDRICSYAAIIALLEYAAKVELAANDTFTVVSLFDNEEIGSLSRQGAIGGSLKTTVERATEAIHNGPLDFHSLWANSLILSADVNHLFNPNFAQVYLEDHRPKPNIGVTLSIDTNQHMVTDVVGITVAEELARINGDSIQYFHIKNNSRSGGTIGPFVSSQTGARTIDLGIPQLSMHSIRATTGSRDVGLGIKFFRGFFKNWRPVLDRFGDL